MRSLALTPVGDLLAGAGAPPGSTAAAQSADMASAALAVLRKSISVDVHSHGGRTGIISQAPPSDDLANAMRAGSLAATCLADVPDGPVLGRNAEGALAAVRSPASGEVYRHHLERLAWMDELVAKHGLRRALSAADLEAAHAGGEPSVVADTEGLDFLEGKLERLEEAHGRGIRHVQLVHYTPNDIGDFQTGAVTHDGLTEFGAETIRACVEGSNMGDKARIIEQVNTIFEACSFQDLTGQRVRRALQQLQTVEDELANIVTNATQAPVERARSDKINATAEITGAGPDLAQDEIDKLMAGLT